MRICFHFNWGKSSSQPKFYYIKKNSLEASLLDCCFVRLFSLLLNVWFLVPTKRLQKSYNPYIKVTIWILKVITLQCELSLIARAFWKFCSAMIFLTYAITNSSNVVNFLSSCNCFIPSCNLLKTLKCATFFGRSIEFGALIFMLTNFYGKKFFQSKLFYRVIHP